ncbi:DNA adenine methylase [Burkholderia latens]|uniref:DNA adenine methylase n=1 Tax=Burkholderia latens TaxID=488446 RepID=UPI000B020863
MHEAGLECDAGSFCPSAGGLRRLVAGERPAFADHQVEQLDIGRMGDLDDQRADLDAKGIEARESALAGVRQCIVRLDSCASRERRFVFLDCFSGRQPAAVRSHQSAVDARQHDIQRAARFYYLQKSCFGAKLEGQTFGTATTTPPGLNLLRIEEELSAAYLRLANTFVERLDWAACIDRYDRPHTLFYLDPPYYETEGYGVAFPFAEYEKMAEWLRTLKGRAIVSLNDHPDIRRVSDGFHIETVPIHYTVGGGKGVERNELIIFSWNDAAQPAGLF